MTKQKSKAERPRNSNGLKSRAGEYTEKNVTRFWSKVNKNGTIPVHHPELGPCWEWMGGGNGKGYGQVRINYRQMGTHQVAWELMHGRVPRDLWVLHKCNNPNCMNPDHLFLGTAKDNTSDMIRKNRRRPYMGYSTGTKRHHLTAEEILTLKTRYANGESQTALARDFDVSRVTVSNILKGKTRQPKR